MTSSALLDYYIRRIMEWAIKRLPTAEEMTSEQRRDEVEWLIDRANEMCDADQVPGVYIRIGKQKYAELVQEDKIEKVMH